MTTSTFRVWTTPGRIPVWGDVKVMQQRTTAADEYEIIVQGDGSDLEQLVRKQPRAFIMFERSQNEADNGLIWKPRSVQE